MNSSHPCAVFRSKACRTATVGFTGWLAGILLICGLANPFQPAHAEPPATLKVMEQNLYLGGTVSTLALATTPQQLATAIAQFWASVQATNFPERADSIADGIAAESPHIIGLSEAALWRTGPADGIGNPNGGNAAVVVYDTIQILLDKLAARGHHYTAIAVSSDADREITLRTAAGLRDIRWTDRNAILVRTDLPTQVFSVGTPVVQRYEVMAATFVPVLNLVVTTPHSWLSVDVTLRGRKVRFVTTHLSPLNPAVQAAELDELLAGPLDTSDPTVLTGDLNSAADPGTGVPGFTETPTYIDLLVAGFQDAWMANHANDPGYTCCQALNLRNDPSSLVVRIDYILTRGAISAVTTHRVGVDPEDRTVSGMWPSDHAGLVSVLQTQ